MSWLVLLLVVATLVAVWVLMKVRPVWRSRRPADPWRPSRYRQVDPATGQPATPPQPTPPPPVIVRPVWYAYSLFAWLIVALAALITGVHGIDYPFLWFWLWFWIGVILTGLSILPGISLIRLVHIIGWWLLLYVAVVSLVYGNNLPWSGNQGGGGTAQRDCSAIMSDWQSAYDRLTAINRDPDLAGYDANHLPMLTTESTALQQKMAGFQVELNRNSCSVAPSGVTFDVTQEPGSLTVTVIAKPKPGASLQYIPAYRWAFHDPNRADDVLSVSPTVSWTYSGPVSGISITLNVADAFGRTYQDTQGPITVPLPAATQAPTPTTATATVPPPVTVTVTATAAPSSPSNSPGTGSGSSTASGSTDERLRPNATSAPPTVIRPGSSTATTTGGYATADCDKDHNGIPDPGCG